MKRSVKWGRRENMGHWCWNNSRKNESLKNHEHTTPEA